MKIIIKSIDELLRKPNLKNSLNIGIIFISTRPNYFNFGYTPFLQIFKEDENTPYLSDWQVETLNSFIDNHSTFDIIYVCCDAGIRRSPAVALYIAARLGNEKEGNRINKMYIHFWKELYTELITKTFNMEKNNYDEL